jgi:hypothetical protein
MYYIKRHNQVLRAPQNIESEVLDPIQTHPAQPHLTNPESALEAHVKDLLDMSPQDKNILRASLTLAHRAKLSPERKAAVNIDCVMPIVQDSGTPYGEETVQRFRSEDGTQEFAIVNRRQEDRWYAVFKGRGFTGVVRGKEKYDEYVTSGVSGANGKKARNRAEAEFNWLVMYYKGQTGPL